MTVTYGKCLQRGISESTAHWGPESVDWIVEVDWAAEEDSNYSRSVGKAWFKSIWMIPDSCEWNSKTVRRWQVGMTTGISPVSHSRFPLAISTGVAWLSMCQPESVLVNPPKAGIYCEVCSITLYWIQKSIYSPIYLAELRWFTKLDKAIWGWFPLRTLTYIHIAWICISNHLQSSSIISNLFLDVHPNEYVVDKDKP